MSQSLAYHLVVHALEGRSDWTPSSRFASAVAHVANGHLPYERYNAAGHSRASQGATEGQIEAAVIELLNLDLTPGVRLISSLTSQAVMIGAFNEYIESAGIAVRTNVRCEAGVGAADRSDRNLAALCEMRLNCADPWPCRAATLAMFRGMLKTGALNQRVGRRKAPSLASVAELLGVGASAAAEAAMIFERDGSMPVSELARKLGCHQRSLERKLRAEGTTAEALRSAARMLRASDRLASNDSLTTIAVEEGFSDLAHMSRSFKISAGAQPSALRNMLRADAETATVATAADYADMAARPLSA